jgi:hypothetical protein
MTAAIIAMILSLAFLATTIWSAHTALKSESEGMVFMTIFTSGTAAAFGTAAVNAALKLH